MFISEFLLNNPERLSADTDLTLYNKAKLHHAYFKDNNLWFVNKNRRRSHVFFDGEHVVEVAEKYVRFPKDITKEDFTVIPYGDSFMVRFKRGLKPSVYYPTVKGLECGVPGTFTSSERYLLERWPGLAEHCLYYKGGGFGFGWSINFCQNNYPLKPGLSVSMHTVKMYDWLKTEKKVDWKPTSKVFLNQLHVISF